MFFRLIIAAVLSAACAAGAEAFEPRGSSTRDSAPASQPAHSAQPSNDVAPDRSWVGVMVLLIFGLFLAAAAVGIVVRASDAVEKPSPHHQEHAPDSPGH